MATQINIHPDFQKIRGISLPFNPWALALMNGALQLAAAKKWWKYKTIVTQRIVIGLDGHRIPVWLIKPAHVKTPAPALVYCHGGAFILKHSPQHIENAIRYAHEANCYMLFVDYRLAPKHAFPAGFNDCYATLIWAYQNAEKLGVDKQRIAVGGDSAGGTMAAGIAQKTVEENTVTLRGQLLIYPVTDSDCKSISGTAYADIPPFKRLSLRRTWTAYLGHDPAAGVPRYASPIHGKLTGLARAYIETGEYDALCDEGKAYASALIAHGVDVICNETKGTVHGYDALVPDSKLSKDAMKSREQFLLNIFNTEP